MKIDTHQEALWAAILIGVLAAVGRTLAEAGPFNWRYALGRSLVSAVISVAAFSVLAWIPGASPLLIVGVSALLASLGTSGLTMLAQRFFR